MKKKLAHLIPYAIALAVIFYILPLLTRNTGFAMLLMLIGIPFLTFACSVIYGVLHGFALWLPALVVFLFAPSIFLFYNSSAWIYIVAYGILSIIGMLVGRKFHKIR